LLDWFFEYNRVRKCHFCHEPVAAAARECPHCSADLIRRASRRDTDGAATAHAFVETADEEKARLTRRMYEAAGLFVVLVVVYAIYLQGLVDAANAVVRPDLMRLLAKFCLISGVPFAVLAFADRDWESEHAAPIAFLAWGAAFWYFSQKYGAGCPAEFALFFIPLVISALAAHTIGALRHRLRTA
jgi:hypothetical protein